MPPFHRSNRLVSRRSFLASTTCAPLFLGPASNFETSSSDAMIDDEEMEDCVRPDRLWQYKRLVKEQIARIHDGQYDKAIECLNALATNYPSDPEFMYGLSLAHCGKGDLHMALDFTQRALDAGMPFSRFQAGPRTLLDPLYKQPGFSRMLERYGSSLVHGPMLGCLTDSAASFWVRTWMPSRVTIVLTPEDINDQVSLSSNTASTTPDTDFTGIAHAENLTPDTKYTYQVRINDVVLPETYRFRTHPRSGSPGVFSIGFGGCAGYTPWHERIWRTIQTYEFCAFLLTGDNVYIDDPLRDTVQQYCYYRRQSRPEYQGLVSSTSIAAIWDDHDFGTNDSWGGTLINEPSWKIPVWRTFRNNWNNPGYGGGENSPGCWFRFSVADVDFFMLDDRFYRTNHKNPPIDEPITMLGAAQKTWLFENILESTATFKIIVTSVPWAYGVKPGSSDPWQGFQAERKELFDFLHDHRVEGVILLSGDRHRADIWKIEREHGYPLYDFENARLTNLHTHDVLPGAMYGYNEKCTFGRLRFDTTRSDPQVTYDIISIDNELIYSFSISHSMVSYA